MTRLRHRAPNSRSKGWQPTGPVLVDPIQTLDAGAYRRGKVTVITAVELAELPDGSGEIGPQWHVSISRGGRRPKPAEVARALRAFGMRGAEEDNHHPGNARHFWLPVDPARRVECECKTEEATVVEPDGYTWTNPHDEAECRGCEFEAILGRPCPVHGAKLAVG